MSYNAADGAALVAAAVQAVIRERAPRRTVAAVAAAVAGTVMSAAASPPAARPQMRTQDAKSETLEADDPEKLLASLRAVRRAQRLRKKQRRREAKQAAGISLRVAETPQQPQEEFSSRCVVCLERPKELMVRPCKHLCLCKACSRMNVWQHCPVCRGPVHEQEVVYT